MLRGFTFAYNKKKLFWFQKAESLTIQICVISNSVLFVLISFHLFMPIVRSRFHLSANSISWYSNAALIRRFRKSQHMFEMIFEKWHQPISDANEMNFEMVTNPRQPTPMSLIFFTCFVFCSCSVSVLCAGINSSFYLHNTSCKQWKSKTDFLFSSHVSSE